jgi:hypothetical protein
MRKRGRENKISKECFGNRKDENKIIGKNG